MRQRCPVCQARIHADDAAFAHHVQAHFEGGTPSSDSEPEVVGQGGEGDEVLWADEQGEVVAAFGQVESSVGTSVSCCPVCMLSWGGMSSTAKEEHVASHFVSGRFWGGAEQDPPSPRRSESKTHTGKSKGKERAPSDPGSSTVGSGKRHARDWTWCVGSERQLPKNVTPDVIPALKSMLDRSSTTRSAVLCAASALYITSIPLFDLTWGCGYRNFQMTYSTYLSALPSALKEPPAVFDLQSWIETAWSAGYDDVGCKQLGGRLIGRNKWIGTADIWVGLSFKGIRCRLFDFPQMEQKNHTHSILIRWVADYFKPEFVGEKSAFNDLMATQGATVRMSDKLPLILQHQGHSRTIVGVETLRNGETNLLVFDPGKTLPSHLRDDILESRATSPPAVSVSSSSSVELEEKETDGNSSKKRLWGSDKAKGLKRQKIKAFFGGKEGDLKVFRVSIKSLKRNAAYQILAFEPPPADKPLMGPQERATRKHVVADRIVK